MIAIKGCDSQPFLVKSPKIFLQQCWGYWAGSWRMAAAKLWRWITSITNSILISIWLLRTRYAWIKNWGTIIILIQNAITINVINVDDSTVNWRVGVAIRCTTAYWWTCSVALCQWRCDVITGQSWSCFTQNTNSASHTTNSNSITIGTARSHRARFRTHISQHISVNRLQPVLKLQLAIIYSMLGNSCQSTTVLPWVNSFLSRYV